MVVAICAASPIMVGGLLLRRMLVGVVAAVVALGFAKVFGES
jgi:hypothetical protein